MTRFGLRGCMMGIVAAAVLAGPAFAGGASTDQQAAVARLEALLQQQQQQIEMLEQQVAAAGQEAANEQRMEVTRQQVREILSEQEFREKLMPSMLQAGYDDGFFIRSSDDKFLLKVNGGVQFRYTYYNTDSQNDYLLPRFERDDRSGFDVQRIRFALSGHAYTEDLTYWMEFQSDAPDGYNVVASEVWANWRFTDELQFRAGLMRLPSTRQQSYYELNQQMIDRPLVDAMFGMGFGIGAQIWGELMDDRLEYHLAVVNGVADGEFAYLGRTITPDPEENDGNPAILFRTTWQVLGDDPENDFATMQDRDLHQTPAMEVGFHYVWNDNYHDRVGATRIPFSRATVLDGGFGLVRSNGLAFHQFGLDTGFKYMGFSANAEYILRLLDVRRAGRTPFAPYWLLTGQDATVTQHGAYLQLGYFLPIPGMEDKFEAVSRVGGISTNGADGVEGTWEYTLGMNYYLEDNVKLQADATYVHEVPITSGYSSLANVNDDALVFRVQFQMAF